MHDIVRLNRLLNQLGQKYRIANLHMGAEGTCAVDLADRTVLSFEHVESQQKLFVYSPVSPLPPEERERLCLYGVCLRFNDLELGTEGGTLAICSERNVINLQASFAVSTLDTGTLDRGINEFLARHKAVVPRLRMALQEDLGKAGEGASYKHPKSRADEYLRASILAAQDGNRRK